MLLAGGSLVLQAPPQDCHPQVPPAVPRASAHGPASAEPLLPAGPPSRGTRGLRGEAPPDFRGYSPIIIWAGACPKCGRRKVRRRKGRKWCPRCGPIK